MSTSLSMPKAKISKAKISKAKLSKESTVKWDPSPGQSTKNVNS